MKKLLLSFFITSFLILISGYSHAIILSLVPASSQATNGDIITLDLVISELSSSSAPSLGDFDINIAYDNSIMSFVTYTLGNQLGDLSFFEADDWSTGNLGNDLINLAGVSYLSPSELHNVQSDSFVLASLDFTITHLAPNTSTTISIDSVASLSDQDGAPLSNISTQNAIISSSSTAVPEPSVWILLALGLLSIRLAK